MNIMGVNINSIRQRRGTWCKWDRPPSGWCKLNIDGSAQEDGSSGGGIIGNSEGEIVAGFSYFYGEASNNLTELFALKDGMTLCKALQILPVLIENDSSIVVLAIRTRHARIGGLDMR